MSLRSTPNGALRAGPLTLVYEGAGIRWIRLDDREVLRGIYVAVRDRHWRTIPPTIRDLTIDAREDSFRIELTAEHRHLEIDFHWRGTIVGQRSGALAFTMDGTAERSFLKNRIGFCVLHPMQECSGRPCTVEHVDGHISSTSFPALVSPQQAFLGVRALAHEVMPGVIAEVRMEGDVFETEDQRNWSDTSFKTYCPPVDQPFPVEIAAGTQVRQKVRLRLRGAASVRSTAAASGTAAAVKAKDDAVRIEATDTRYERPRIGLQLDATQPLSMQESTRLRALGLSHLRVDLDLTGLEAHWRAALRSAATQAEAVGTSLWIAALVGESPREALAALADARVGLPAPIDAWLLFDRATGTSPASLLTSARELLARSAPARIGGGSNVHFADLNRNRPSGPQLDLLVYPMSPQAHADDAETMVENIESIASVVSTARSFCPGVPVALSPVTLKPRRKPGAPDLPPLGSLPDDIDVRQASRFTAAWTVSHLRAIASAGVESVTYFRAVGWDGVMEREAGSPMPEAFPSQPGLLFPVHHALADIGAFAGGRMLAMRSSAPQRVDALCLERDGAWRLLVVNLRADRQRVSLPSMRGARDPASPLVLEGYEILELDLDATETKKGDSVLESPFM